MNKTNMFARVLVKSVVNRRTRIVAATLAVLLGVSLISAVAAIAFDARGKVGRELRSYGANILISPKSAEMAIGTGGLSFGAIRESGYLRDDELSVVASSGSAGQIVGYVPYLYGVVELEQQKVVLAGTIFEHAKEVSPWWRITGDWISRGDDNAAIVGANIAKKLGIEIGQKVDLRYGDKSTPFDVVGIVDTGSAEDSQVFVNLSVAQQLLGKPNAINTIQVSALIDSVSAATIAAELQRAIPQSKVSVVGQVADAESTVVGRIETLLFIVSALVLLASALTVASTMLTSVLERTKEIGLMKALGATDGQIAAVFLAEAVVIGAIGGILGSGAGAITASVASRTVFDAVISYNPVVLPLSLAAGLTVALTASAHPVRRATQIDPAFTLRGE
ncbi:MAG: ABC transporter permease [Chloroflexi bacterium]|nr:ABC transporter permease [Chloroflexota bacterium]